MTVPLEIGSRFDWIKDMLRDGELSHGTRNTGTRLILYRSDADGACYPSIATLARETGQNERSVERQIDQLIARGWVRKVSTKGRTSNSYEFTNPGSPTPVEIPDGQATPVQTSPNPGSTVRQPRSSDRTNTSNTKNTARLTRRPLGAPRADASWNGRGVQLAAEIGQANFDSWFSRGKFEEGPEPVIRLGPASYRRITEKHPTWVATAERLFPGVRLVESR